MSVGALKPHAQNGLLQTRGILWIILPALALSVVGATVAGGLSSEVLRKGFGAFLIGLSVVGMCQALRG